MKINRNSSIELLRIIAMVMIIMSHYSYHGATDVSSLPFGFNKYLLEVSVLGNLGVDIFMLISGYFGVRSKFKIKKMILLLGQVWFYSFVFSLIFICMGEGSFSLSMLKKALFPTINKQYWFFTGYILIYLLSDYINKLLLSLTDNEARQLFWVLFFIWCIVPTFTASDLYANQFIQLLMVYIFGAFIRLFSDKIQNNVRMCYAMLGVGGLGWLLSPLLLELIGPIHPYLCRLIENMNARNSIFTLFLAAGLFIAFSYLKVNSRLINQIASTTFGVYLIHDHPFVRKWIWGKAFNNLVWASSNVLAIHYFFSVLIVFTGAAFIELARKKWVDHWLDNIFDKYFSSVLKKVVR